MRRNLIRRWGVLLCAVLMLGSVFSGCSEPEKKRQRETAAPSEQPVDNPEDSSTNLGVWTRAMGSVLIELNEGSAYVFGGYEKNEDNKAAAAKILQSSWNIDGRGALLMQIQTLLKTGDRKKYREEAKDMCAMSKKSLNKAMKQLSGELLVHYQMIQYNWETWGKKGLLGWDMCRISHLAQWGYIADYLTLGEAQAVMEPAVKKCKDNFTSWDDVQNNWLDGYCLYASIDRTAPNTDYTVRKNLYEDLKKEQKEGHLLYDEELFKQDIIPLSDISYQSVVRDISAAEKTSAPKSTGKPKKAKRMASPDSADATGEPNSLRTPKKSRAKALATSEPEE